MRIGKVIGTVTAGRIHPLLLRGQLKIVAPFSFEDLTADSGNEAVPDYTLEHARHLIMTREPKRTGKELIVYDELSAGEGEWIAFTEGAEAAAAFQPDKRPVDAYASAIIDTLEIDTSTLKE